MKLLPDKTSVERCMFTTALNKGRRVRNFPAPPPAPVKMRIRGKHIHDVFGKVDVVKEFFPRHWVAVCSDDETVAWCVTRRRQRNGKVLKLP